jgi:hypothetical protein
MRQGKRDIRKSRGKRDIRKSKEGERLSRGGRRTRGGVRVVRTRFIKGDILRYPHTAGNMVIAAITLVLRAVPKKDALNRLSSQFSTLTRRRKNKTGAPKAPEMAVTGRMTKKALIGRTTVKNRGGLPVYEKNNCRNNLSLEVRWKLKRKK